MTRAESLHAALAATSAVTDISEDRIYPLIALPPQLKPTVIYKFEIRPDYTLGGPGPIVCALQMLSWAATYNVAHDLADEIQEVLMPSGEPKGFVGVMGGAGGIKVIGCRLEQESEEYVAIIQDKYVFQINSLYELRYNL